MLMDLLNLAVPVDMTMGQFFPGGLPDILNRHEKNQVYPRQGVVSVHDYPVRIHLADGNHLTAQAGTGLKPHPLLNMVNPFDIFHGKPHNQRLIPFPIPPDRGNLHPHRIPRLPALQGPLQLGEKLPMAVQVRNRLRHGTIIEQPFFKVDKGVTDGNNLIFCYDHVFLYHFSPKR
jgi:hypothetical protein